MSYTQQWSSATPGLLIILLDQSGSMSNRLQDGRSRAEAATRIVNRMIDNIIARNFNGNKPKDRCRIIVIGYNNDVRILAEGSLNELDENILGFEPVSGTSAASGTAIDEAIWLRPEATGGTDMAGAFALAAAKINEYLSSYSGKTMPAPVIVNVSDGMPNSVDGTLSSVQNIWNISTADGVPLVFNAMIAESSSAISFPEALDDDRESPASFLFQISSVVPDSMRGAAGKSGFALDSLSRGFIYGADADSLQRLIDFGSSKATN